MFSAVKNFFKDKSGFTNIIGRIDRTQKTLERSEKKMDEVYWGLVFNNAIAGSKWLENKTFNPGRWAAGYPMLYILYRIYNDIKPKQILELGLGESTRLAYQYSKYNPASCLTIIEQDINWLKFFSNEIYNIEPNTILIEIEKRSIEGHDVYHYQNLPEKLGSKKFDLINVDGPWGSVNYSRHQIVDLVEKDFLAEKFIILLDDYNRNGEKQTAERLREMLKRKNIPFVEGVYSGMKQTLIICSPSFQFLTSL